MRPTIIWDTEDDPEGNFHHIVTEGHGVTQEEVDEVLGDRHSERVVNRGAGEWICFGLTSLGQYIAVVFDEACDDPLMLYPITAFKPDEPGARGQ